MRRPQLAILLAFGFATTACAVKFEVQTTVMAVTALPPSIATLLPTQFRPPATMTPAPTRVPTASAMPEPSATATPDPYSPYFVENLRARTYEGGPIEIASSIEQTDAYTTYAITYPSDGLKITGLMNVPNGRGPFPVVILNHGHIDETIYKPGDDTKAAADFFARQGFLTLSTSYRNQGGSDTGNNYFRTGYAMDVLNLIASVKTIPQADANNLVVWGHSMGGGVSLEVAVVNPPNVKGYILYAPMSGDFTANYYRIAWFRGWATPGPDWPVPPESAPAAYTAMSPLNYINDIGRPIRIHQGYVDDQVPADWSLHLNTALTLAGKDTQLYEYAGANHNFYNADWDLFMSRCLEFYNQVLGQ